MRSYIDENDKKNEIRLLFNHPLYKDKIIIALEGGSDIKLFRSVLSNINIKFEHIDGKSILISAMNELVKEFPKRIAAICDADYDHLGGKSKTLENLCIYVTDHHDAEIMMLCSPALQSFIQEYSAHENIQDLESGVFDAAFGAAYSIGILRWINNEERLNLKFRKLNFNLFVDINCLNVEVNMNVLIDELLKRSANKEAHATKEYLLNKLEEYRSFDACRLQVCCGHDITNIIAIIYRQRWASTELNMDQRKVESSLRLGFQREYFTETDLYKNIIKFIDAPPILKC